VSSFRQAVNTCRIYAGTDENGIVGTVAPGLFAQEGRCWRMFFENPVDHGTHCMRQVEWVGRWKFLRGWTKAWSCERHDGLPRYVTRQDKPPPLLGPWAAHLTTHCPDPDLYQSQGNSCVSSALRSARLRILVPSMGFSTTTFLENPDLDLSECPYE
jgi:hypothetical protein